MTWPQLCAHIIISRLVNWCFQTGHSYSTNLLTDMWRELWTLWSLDGSFSRASLQAGAVACFQMGGLSKGSSVPFTLVALHAAGSAITQTRPLNLAVTVQAAAAVFPWRTGGAAETKPPRQAWWRRNSPNLTQRQRFFFFLSLFNKVSSFLVLYHRWLWASALTRL